MCGWLNAEHWRLKKIHERIGDIRAILIGDACGRTLDFFGLGCDAELLHPHTDRILKITASALGSRP